MVRYSFPGKVVLVTGASRGMGAAILSGFARAGAVCYLNYYPDADGANQADAQKLAEQLQAGGGNVHLVAADVARFDEVEAMMQQIRANSGGLDILVNNAGILRDRTIKKMALEEWHAVLRTNLDGVFHCCKAGAEILRDDGRIVNIASISGIVGIHGQSNYSAAKAGVMGLTRVLSRELARRRITVNAVAPGIIETPMLGALKPEVRATYEQQIPVGRIGQPDDVANAVLFLASEESSFITGVSLPITGGWY